MSKEFWEDDATAETTVPAPSGGDFWLSDAPADAAPGTAPDTGDESQRLAARYPAPKEVPERTFGGTMRDIGVTALKGAVGLPQAVVGLADIPTGGRVGRALESVGYRPGDAQKILEDTFSPAQQAASEEVKNADGFVGTARAMLENPSTIAVATGESLPQMLGGAGVARGVMSVAPKVAPWIAGAVGEGVIGAGSAASQLREQSADGLLTPKQSAAALATGVGTGVLGAAGGRLAQRAGLPDVDTMLATGKLAQSPVGFIKAVIGSGVSEGVFEEMPQSAQEQMWQNYATDKPILEGVDKAMAQGVIAGAAMGAGAGGASAAVSLRKPIDRTPQIEALRKTGDETAAALLEQRQQKEQAAYSTDRETQALEQFFPEIAQRYREVRMAGAKTGDAVVQTAARWNFEQAAQMAGLSQRAQEVIAAKLAEVPPEKAAGFVQKAITGMVQAGKAQPFDGMETLAQTIEAQRDQMLDSVLATMSDIETLEQQDAQDPAQGAAQAETGPVDAAPAAAIPDGADAVSGGNEPGGVPALSDINDVIVTPELDAVHAAATSPLNDLPEPTDAQKKAGNYKVGKIRMSGMDISIENPQGSERRGVDADGKEWVTPMRDHYGYFKGTTAADGDKLDVFIKPGTPQDYAGPVFVVDQVDPKTGKFDEHKVVFGAADKAEAEAIYRRNYSADWNGLANITALPMPAFKAWASSKATRKPLGAITEQTNVQDAAPRTEAQAAAATVEASTPARGDAAAAAELPATGAGAGVRADGVTLKDGARITLSEQPAPEAFSSLVRSEFGEPKAVIATNDAGEEVGRLTFMPNGGPIDSFVREQDRRRGVGTALYDALEARGGKLPPVESGVAISEDARAFRAARSGQTAANSATTPELLGQNSAPISEGGKPFKTEAAARKEKKLHPDKRVVKAPGGKGYVLKPMSPKQIAAQEAAARRIKGADTGEAGPLSAHGFILARGGLAKSSMADAGFDKNVRIGNRWLFTNTGKTLAQAGQALKEAGFITEETENAASDIIRRSIASPQYTAEGWETVAEAEAQTRFEDYLSAQQESEEDPFATLTDHGYTEEDAQGTGYDEASPEIQAEVAALSSQLEAMGEDSESIRERVALQYPDATQQEYHEHVKAAITAAIAEAAQPAGRGDPGQDDGEQGQAREGTGESLTDRPDGTLSVKGDTAVIKDRLTTAGIPAKSILPSATGVVVGKTQAAKAREVLEAPTLTAPTQSDIEAQQARAEQADKLDERAQVKRESEAGADSFTLTREDGRDGGTQPMFSRTGPAPTFYSALAKEISKSPMNAGNAGAWAQYLDALAKRGAIKADEVEWTGLREWLKLQDGKVTKAQIAEYLDANGVQVTETVLGDEARETAAERWMQERARLEFAMPFDSLDEADQDYIRGKAEDANITPERLSKYSQYTLPGGENYREVLLTLPGGQKIGSYAKWLAKRLGITESEAEERPEYDDDAIHAKFMAEESSAGKGYKSSHWDQPNVLAHIRVNDRVDADGKRVLFVEELQSDWGQDGKKKGFSSPITPDMPMKAVYDRGYWEVSTASGEFITNVTPTDYLGADSFNNGTYREITEAEAIEAARKKLRNGGGGTSQANAIPRAPFVDKTDKWLALSLKRIMKMAVDGGYDRVAFVNGEQSAERYDLSKQVSRLAYDSDGTLEVFDMRGDNMMTRKASEEELPDLIGKETAQRLIDAPRTPGGRRSLDGDGLKVGGEGMKAFYDKIVPAAVKDVLKKVGGGQMESVKIGKSYPTPGRFDTEQDAKDWIKENAVGRFAEPHYEIRYKQWSVRGEDGAVLKLPEQTKYTQPGFTITDSMREKVAGGLPLFNRQPVDADLFRRMTAPMQRGMAPADLQKAIAPVLKRWENGPNVTVVATTTDLPMKAPGDVHGVYFGGNVYLVAQNITNKAKAMEVLTHEAIAHHGLRNMLGKDDWKKFMGNIQLALKTGNKPLNTIRKDVRAAYVDDAGKFNLSELQEADEIAAKVVEQAVDADGNFRPGFGFVKSVYAKVVEFLRSIGIDVKMTMAELQGALVNAQRFLETGNRTAGAKKTAKPVFARAYHGTPHRFERFTTDAIGTGEGAQAYGYGLYFASRREIAEHYRDTLSRDKYYIGDKPADETNPLHVAAATIEYAGSASEAETILAKEMTASYNTPDMRDVYARALQAIQDGERIPDARRRAGSLYEVEIPEDTEMLLWDKPLSEQPAKVREAMKEFARDIADNRGIIGANLDAIDVFKRRAETDPDTYNPQIKALRKDIDELTKGANFDAMTGEEAYRRLTDDLGRSQKAASEALQAAGIRGIKYMDGVSRNKALRDVKREFLAELPEDADFDEVMELVGTGAFSPKNDDVIKALAADDWLGFDYPSQALSAALSGRLDNYDASPALVQAVAATQDDSTYNYVVFSGDDVSIVDAAFSRTAKTPASIETEKAVGAAKPAQAEMFQPGFWDAPQETRLDNVIYELQDGRIDLKRVQEAITKANVIPEKFDARLAETLYPGRVATRSEKFLNDEAKPLLDAMARNNVTMDELADYLHARHAEERNKQIAKVNPDLPDGGAGKNSKGVLMTTEAAKAHIAGLSEGKRMVLDAMSKRVDAITQGTTKLLVDEGLEKQEAIDAWTGAYKSYVPLFRDEAENGNPHPTGSGMSVRGGSSKRAVGSTKKATNILAHVLMQREAAITRAEKNRVAVALYGLALTNPNPDFWTTIKPSMSPKAIGQELQRMGVDPTVAEAGMQGVPTIKTVDPTLGRVVSRPNPMYKSLPGAIVLKVNGEDRVLMLNTNDPRGLRMAENLKNLDGLTRLDLANRKVGKVTRWMASVNTQYNPAFGLVNLTRDTLGGAINLSSTKLRGKTLKVLALTPGALKGIGLELSGKKSGEWGRLFRQFQADGGQTGFREQFKDANDRAKALESELKALEKAGKLSATKVAGKMLDALDIFNTTLENAVRLAAYKEALQEGMSRPEAARLGRELTVDFNRKGRMGRELGPLYAFFNASVQGSARTLQTLAGPAGAKIIAGGVSLGVLQAIMLLAAGYDDDEVPEFIKARALIVPLGTDDEGKKRYFTLPLPLGLHVLPNTGRVLAELTLDGGKDIASKSFDAVGEIAGAFNPLGGGNIFTGSGALRTVAPTIVDPIIETMSNENFAGTPIEREKFDNDPRPGFQRAREGTLRTPTGQTYTEISRIINTMTGGDEYEAGKASPSPEMVRYWAQVVGGGLLREIEKTVNTSIAIAKGDDTKPTGFPVLGRFYGEVDDESVQRTRYYDNLAAIEKAEKMVKAAEKAGDLDAAQRIEEAKPEALLGKDKNRAQKDLRELNREAMETVGDRQAIKAIDAERTEVMRELNSYARDIDKERRDGSLGGQLRKALGLADVNP